MGCYYSLLEPAYIRIVGEFFNFGWTIALAKIAERARASAER
jgi:hypothetical protein